MWKFIPEVSWRTMATTKRDLHVRKVSCELINKAKALAALDNVTLSHWMERLIEREVQSHDLTRSRPAVPPAPRR